MEYRSSQKVLKSKTLQWKFSNLNFGFLVVYFQVDFPFCLVSEESSTALPTLFCLHLPKTCETSNRCQAWITAPPQWQNSVASSIPTQANSCPIQNCQSCASRQQVLYPLRCCANLHIRPLWRLGSTVIHGDRASQDWRKCWRFVRLLMRIDKLGKGASMHLSIDFWRFVRHLMILVYNISCAHTALHKRASRLSLLSSLCHSKMVEWMNFYRIFFTSFNFLRQISPRIYLFCHPFCHLFVWN